MSEIAMPTSVEPVSEFCDRVSRRSENYEGAKILTGFSTCTVMLSPACTVVSAEGSAMLMFCAAAARARAPQTRMDLKAANMALRIEWVKGG